MPISTSQSQCIISGQSPQYTTVVRYQIPVSRTPSANFDRYEDASSQEESPFPKYRPITEVIHRFQKDWTEIYHTESDIASKNSETRMQAE